METTLTVLMRLQESIYKLIPDPPVLVRRVRPIAQWLSAHRTMAPSFVTVLSWLVRPAADVPEYSLGVDTAHCVHVLDQVQRFLWKCHKFGRQYRS